MIKPIIHDTFFLSRKSEPATAADLAIAKDLRDTLAAHRDGCVGMAANMIGYSKRIIIVFLGMFDMVMLNPEIMKKSGLFETEEGCLLIILALESHLSGLDGAMVPGFESQQFYAAKVLFL